MDSTNPADIPPSSGRTPSSSEEGPTTFEVWKSYEEIAMHFNELIIRMRVQALGGLAAITAIIGIVLKESEGGAFHWNVLGSALLALTPFWAAVWILDLRYYTPLLYGAVSALLTLEEKSSSCTRWKTLDLSTSIERVLRGELPAGNVGRSPGGPKWFYITVMLGLLFMSVFSFSAGYFDKKDGNAPGAPNAPARPIVPQPANVPNGPAVGSGGPSGPT